MVDFIQVEFRCSSLKISKDICSILLNRKLVFCVDRLRGERYSLSPDDGTVVEEEVFVAHSKTISSKYDDVVKVVCEKDPESEISFKSIDGDLGSKFFTKMKAFFENTQSDDVLNRSVINKENALRLRNDYVNSLPFPRLQLENVVNNDVLEDAYDCLALDTTYEPMSNDLYLFNQSEDLVALGERQPIIKKLSQQLYSPQMLEFLSEISGIKLNNKVDMAVSLYTKGCHLLCHDDRMTTRLV